MRHDMERLIVCKMGMKKCKKNMETSISDLEEGKKVNQQYMKTYSSIYRPLSSPL